MSLLQQFLPSANPQVPVNENFDTLQALALYARDPSGSSALTWAYYGSAAGGGVTVKWGGFTIAAGSFILTDAATNYVVVEIATGATTCGTSATNWNDAAFARVYKIVTLGGLVSTIEDHRAGPRGIFAAASSAGGMTAPRVVQVAVSDEATALTTGTAKVTFRMPFAMTLRAGGAGARASLTTAQATSGAGGLVTVDVKESGASVLSTKITIDNTEKTSLTAATPPVVSDTALADDAEITVDITVIGDGTAKGLKLTLIGD